jgi:hypothetical protein
LNHSQCHAAEESLKSLQKAIKGEQVAVQETRTAADGEAAATEKLKKLFKCGDAELAVGTLVDAAMCKGALLQC